MILRRGIDRNQDVIIDKLKGRKEKGICVRTIVG